MKHWKRILLSTVIFLWTTFAYAQDVGNVSPATTPPTLPGDIPVSLTSLRENNPLTIPMVGTWKFRLTHGKTVDGEFIPANNQFTASSEESEHPPVNAFDDDVNTRWCAGGENFPQWLQADMKQVLHVTSVDITWERAGAQVFCKIEGGMDGRNWKTLADHTKTPLNGDGPCKLTPADVRYIRIDVLKVSNGWASIRKFQIHTLQNGNDIVWKPGLFKYDQTSDNAFAGVDYNDKAWDDIPVPSNWEMLGYSLPTYNAVDNTAGLYRRWVNIPNSFAGKRIFWHFDGVMDGADIFVNGVHAGYHESGYTAFQVDITHLVHPGEPNLFAVRACKDTTSSDCETGDYQTFGGIFRFNYLLATPQTYIRDVVVTTDLDSLYRNATLSGTLKIQGAPGETVSASGELFSFKGDKTPMPSMQGDTQLDSNGAGEIALKAPVTAPKLWSAEKPNLYYLVFTLQSGGTVVQRIEQRFGFRKIEIRNSVLYFNGKPIKLEGTCRHEVWATLGSALNEKAWLEDLKLIKGANINAIRTSHYNDAERFLELCDEKGIYLLDEAPFCWISDDLKNNPAYAKYTLQRTEETIARDKNHACVLAWSIGNENGYGKNLQTDLTYARSTDPTRPAFVSGMGPKDMTGESFRDAHYPSPTDVMNFLSGDCKTVPAIFTENPHIFYQKEAQDYDPGVSDLWSETLIKIWKIIWQEPTIVGSFIWEWQNQGVADKNKDTTTDFWYGPHHLRQENNKGIVDSFRHPKAEWWIVKMAYSPVVISQREVTPSNGSCKVSILNHYFFTNLNELTCRWTALKGGQTMQNGDQRINCEPQQAVTAQFPDVTGMTALQLEFLNSDGDSIVTYRLRAEGAPLPAPPALMTEGSALTISEGPTSLRIANDLNEIVFNKSTGELERWDVNGKGLITIGPILNLGESKEGNEKGYLYSPTPPRLDNSVVTAKRMDGFVRVLVTQNVHSSADNANYSSLECQYDIHPNASINVQWTLYWWGSTEHAWETGLKFLYPKSMTDMSWSRHSYFTYYPKGHIGEPAGACSSTDVSFRSSKRCLHWMTLTKKNGMGFALIQRDDPLTARANVGEKDNVLIASRHVSGPKDFSWPWVSNHDIILSSGKPVSGEFILHALAKDR